jgi:hypothetical protein
MFVCHSIIRDDQSALIVVLDKKKINHVWFRSHSHHKQKWSQLALSTNIIHYKIEKKTSHTLWKICTEMVHAHEYWIITKWLKSSKYLYLYATGKNLYLNATLYYDKQQHADTHL